MAVGGEQDVLGLEVAVDEVPVVQELNGGQDLGGVEPRNLGREYPLLTVAQVEIESRSLIQISKITQTSRSITQRSTLDLDLITKTKYPPLRGRDASACIR